MVSVWPQVEWGSENFEEMKQQGLLVKQSAGVDAQMIFHGNNVFMDATNPRTRQYVWEKCKRIMQIWGSAHFGWMRRSRSLPIIIMKCTSTTQDRYPRWEMCIRENIPDFFMKARKTWGSRIL